jgi:DNA-binding protein HU-beta
MTKLELVEQLANKAGISKKDAERYLDTTIQLIQEALKSGNKVSLTGLGIFSVKEKKARIGRNPKTGEQVQIPAKKAAKFTAGKELKALLQA